MKNLISRIAYEIGYFVRKRVCRLPYVGVTENTVVQFDTLAETLEWHGEQLNRDDAEVFYRQPNGGLKKMNVVYK